MSENYPIHGDWNIMVPCRITFPEPVYNLLQEIIKRKGKNNITDEIRDYTINGIKESTGIDILKITT